MHYSIVQNAEVHDKIACRNHRMIRGCIYRDLKKKQKSLCKTSMIEFVLRVEVQQFRILTISIYLALKVNTSDLYYHVKATALLGFRGVILQV